MGGAYKRLGKNILLFSISSFGTKIIGFLLVPLYTNYLTTAQYGVADMLYTIVSILVPVFTVDIADGVIRYVLDKRFNTKSVFTVAIRVTLVGSAVLCGLLLIVRNLPWFDFPDLYYVFLFLNFLCTSFYNTMVNYLKGEERIHNIVIGGLIVSFLNAGCNIVFLTKFDMGVEGYLFAHVLSVAVALLYLLICTWRYGYLKFDDLKIDTVLEKEMLIYSAPLILNGLAWWINNSLDRFFVAFICGVSANGLLAVAYKIPSILSMIQTIFNRAWSLSVIKEFDSKDKSGFIGNIYSYYGCAMSICSSVILLANVFIARLLYANDFFVAWQYTGMLIIANLFGGLSVCISGVFNAVKDTKTLAMTTVVGAGLNTVMNAIFIPALGVQGAVIATMLSTLIVWIVRMVKVRSYIKINLHMTRNVVSYVLLIVQCIIGLTESHMYLLQSVILALQLVLYKTEIEQIVGAVLRKVKKSGMHQ